MVQSCMPKLKVFRILLLGNSYKVGYLLSYLTSSPKFGAWATRLLSWQSLQTGIVTERGRANSSVNSSPHPPSLNAYAPNCSLFPEFQPFHSIPIQIVKQISDPCSSCESGKRLERAEVNVFSRSSAVGLFQAGYLSFQLGRQKT